MSDLIGFKIGSKLETKTDMLLVITDIWVSIENDLVVTKIQTSQWPQSFTLAQFMELLK